MLAINEAWNLNELKQNHIVPFRSIKKNKVTNKRDDWGIILDDYLFEIILPVLIVLGMIPFFLFSMSGWIVLCNSEGLIKWIKKASLVKLMRPQFHCLRCAAALQKSLNSLKKNNTDLKCKPKFEFNFYLDRTYVLSLTHTRPCIGCIKSQGNVGLWVLHLPLQHTIYRV